MGAQRANKLEIACEILRAAGRSTSATLPKAIIELLAAKFSLKAAVFYSFSDMDMQKTDKLTLRAQTGLSYQDFPSFLLPLDSIAGRAIIAQKIRQVSDLSKVVDPQESSLARKFTLSSSLVVPLCVDSNGHESQLEPPNVGRLGVLCLYPNSSRAIPSLRRALAELAPIISEAYIQTIDVDKLRFREQVTQRAIASADANSFLHRVCRLLKEDWPYDAISIYTHDERADILRLGATTGLKSKALKSTILLPISDSDETEAICFSRRETHIVIYAYGIDEENERSEALSANPVARIFLPIPEPSNSTEAETILGVIRVTNKKLQHDGRVETVSFGWEDISFLRFASDVVGVILSMFGRVTKSKDDFERSLHGVQNNLNGVLGTLDFIRAQMEKSPDLKRHSYLLPTAKAQLEALAWQVERFSGRERVGPDENPSCHLLPEVFAKLGPLIRPLATAFNTRIEKLPVFNEIFSTIPPVAVAANDVMIVFRNLFENSVKYSKANVALTIEITAKVDSNLHLVEIIYSDNGIGIPERDVRKVFHEGFRSEDAMRRCTTGAGLGLFQCRELLEYARGSIELVSCAEPTQFRVCLPLRRGK